MAEFQDVMKQAKRMCDAVRGCDNCPLDNKRDGCPLAMFASKISLEILGDAERIVMDWAAANPEPRYPTWNEWQEANFQMAERAICAAHFMDAGDAGCYASVNNCDKCRERPIPADIAERLGIKPIGEM